MPRPKKFPPLAARRVPCPPPLDSPDFGTELDAWLDAAKLTAGAFAVLLDVSRQTVLDWKKGLRQPRTDAPAARGYEALRKGTLAADLRREAVALLNRAEQVERLQITG